MWSGAQALTCAGVLRSFTRSHLARIAHVYPEAYKIVVAYSKQRGDQAWDWLLRPGDEVKVGAAVAPPSPHTRRGRKRGAESLSDMAGQAVDPSRPSETRSVRRRLVFTDRVRDHVASHHTVRGHGGEGCWRERVWPLTALVACGGIVVGEQEFLRQRGLEAHAVRGRPWHAGFDLDAVPLPPEVRLTAPPPPTPRAAVAAHNPVVGGVRLDFAGGAAEASCRSSC